MNVILDTNLLISSFLSKNTREQLEQIVISPHIQLLVCDDLLREYSEVLQRPKFHISEHQVRSYLAFLHPKFKHIELVSEISLCRDIKDNFLLALARDGRASYLITGDKDLTTIGFFEQTRIVTLTEFLQYFC
jgi:putative PIN family toxin of toxin-antitoxin system